MKYTLFLYSDEAAFAKLTEAELGNSILAYQAYTQALVEAGVFVSTDWLKPTYTATVVSRAADGIQIQDGPYAATKEQLGGYYVIDVENLDVAIAWAQKCPSINFGLIEIRPSAMA